MATERTEVDWTKPLCVEGTGNPASYVGRLKQPDTKFCYVVEWGGESGEWYFAAFANDGTSLGVNIRIINTPSPEPLTREEMQRMVGRVVKRKSTEVSSLVTDYNPRHHSACVRGEWLLETELRNEYTHPDGTAIVSGSLD